MTLQKVTVFMDSPALVNNIKKTVWSHRTAMTIVYRGKKKYIYICSSELSRVKLELRYMSAGSEVKTLTSCSQCSYSHCPERPVKPFFPVRQDKCKGNLRARMSLNKHFRAPDPIKIDDSYFTSLMGECTQRRQAPTFLINRAIE